VVTVNGQYYHTIDTVSNGTLSLNIDLSPNDKFAFTFAGLKTNINSLKDIIRLDEKTYIEGLISYKLSSAAKLQVGYQWTYAWDDSTQKYALQKRLAPTIQVSTQF
jgi:hypothetical protein